MHVLFRSKFYADSKSAVKSPKIQNFRKKGQNYGSPIVPKDAEFHADSESVIKFAKILYISKVIGKKVKIS